MPAWASGMNAGCGSAAPPKVSGGMGRYSPSPVMTLRVAQSFGVPLGGVLRYPSSCGGWHESNRSGSEWLT